MKCPNDSPTNCALGCSAAAQVCPVEMDAQVGNYDLEVRGVREVYNPDKSLDVWGEVVP